VVYREEAQRLLQLRGPVRRRQPDKTAVIWVPELEDDATLHISYGDLLRRVNEFAALLSDFAGLTAGDRVTMHMPMVPETVVTMLACARLGVIHS
jgi:acetyl-CoA synthetase